MDLHFSERIRPSPESQCVPGDDDGGIPRAVGAGDPGSPDAVPAAAAAPGPHHAVLVPLAVLR